jgi:ribulose-bisphosphate carboxylase large chain
VSEVRGEFLRATYGLRASSAAGAEARAEAIQLEQTVELPRDAVRDPTIEREVMGRVESIEPDADPHRDPRAEGWRVRIAYPVATTGLEPAQLLNVLYGNTSLQPDVELMEVELCPSLEASFGGPRFGIEGLRKATGVEGRALTCTALKPMGLGPDALAELARSFARAGIDVIKDDHGLANQSFCPFDERVRACQRAVDEVARETGQRALYVPNLSGGPVELERQLAQLRRAGARAAMLSPMLVGLPVFSELVRSELQVPVLAHPALAGAQRIAPGALLGTLFRALGADAVIYPHFGGRFSYTEDVCHGLARRLRAPGRLRPALPVPAGGMSVERVPELVRGYGVDSMLLIGGSLYRAGPALLERSREFVRAVATASERT